MSPLFCTTDVPFSHIKDHVKRFGLSQKPRRLGGMKARQILLATPLLKWHLLTRAFIRPLSSHKCFHQFVQDVSDARRLGDTDSSKAIIVDTLKLEGNASFWVHNHGHRKVSNCEVCTRRR